MAYTRTVKVITTTNDQDLLTMPEVEAAITEMLSIDDHMEYERMRQSGIIMAVDIFLENTKVSINNGIYNDLIGNAVYSTDVPTRIYSIRIQDAARTVTISFRAKRVN